MGFPANEPRSAQSFASGRLPCLANRSANSVIPYLSHARTLRVTRGFGRIALLLHQQGTTSRGPWGVYPILSSLLFWGPSSAAAFATLFLGAPITSSRGVLCIAIPLSVGRGSREAPCSRHGFRARGRTKHASSPAVGNGVSKGEGREWQNGRLDSSPKCLPGRMVCLSAPLTGLV